MLKNLWKFRRVVPDLLRLFATAVEAYDDGRLTDEERSELMSQFWALIKKAGKVAAE